MLLTGLALPEWPSACDVRLHNRLHRPGRLAVADFVLHWPWTGPQATARLLCLNVAIAGEGAQVRLPEAWLAARLAPVDLAATLALPARARTLLLNLRLAPWLDALGAALERPVAVVTALDEPPAYRLAVGILAEERVIVAECALGPHAAECLARYLERLPAPTTLAFAAVTLPARVEAGRQWLTVAECRALQPGDVVLLETPAPDSARLVIGDRLGARVCQGDDGWLLGEPLGSLDLARTPPMLDSELDATLDELPLEVICQVGQLRLTLADLRGLGEGSVLPLNADQPGRVELLLNGRRLALGELIRLGEGLGVRLLRMERA
jgi:type III secretion protein Q